MRITVERLRWGLLAGAALLVLAIGGFLGYARYRVRQTLANLPGRLGATITRESSGYTYSQSDGKRTIFTIHAARAVQHTDGTYTLHDVNLVLYGHTGDRADHIAGDEFEYDTKAEMVRAAGTVHIELQAPAAGRRPGLPDGSGTVQVTTSNLVYTRKLGTAVTDKGLDFVYGGFTGHAVGAEYNSDTGHLVLQSEVTVSGLQAGRPVALAAAHGVLDRASREAEFTHARYSSAGEVARAETARLHLRPDGTVAQVDGDGQVELQDAGRGTARCDRAQLALDEKSKPQTAVLEGNVRFSQDQAFRQAKSDARTVNLSFDHQGQIDHAVLRGTVHGSERVRASDDATAPWSERTLAADAVDLKFAASGASKAGTATAKPLLRDATATGSARLHSVTTVTAGVPATGKSQAASRKTGTTTTNLAGDALQAHFVEAHAKTQLATLQGTGHIVVEQSAPGSIEQSSRSQTLAVRFRESDKAKGQVEVAQAVQQGGVVIDRTAPSKPGPAGVSAGRDTQHRVAGRAVYDADSGKVTLTDEVQLSDTTLGTKNEGTSTILAAMVVTDLESGNATAEGGVRVTLLRAGATDAVHVLAATADLDHDTGQVIFHGRAAGTPATGTGLARMWQAAQEQAGSKPGAPEPGRAKSGGSQIEAPVLVFEQASKRLTARPEKPGETGTVHTLLTRAASPHSGDRPKSGDQRSGAAARDPGQQVPVRITSSEMVYSEEQRQAVFRGGVRLVDVDGEMRAQEATVFLTPAERKPGKTAVPGPKIAPDGIFGGQIGGQMVGEIDRIVATRQIELTQPGLLATGDRLVYTATDQLFVLTGTPAMPPRVVDALRASSTTGTELRFHSGDDSVSVVGGAGTKVHTETRIESRAGEGPASKSSASGARSKPSGIQSDPSGNKSKTRVKR